jgi:hypothetical protein
MTTFTSVPSLPSDHPGAVHRSAPAGGGCLPGPFRGASRYYLQLEALLTTARESSKPCDFALVAMLGLRIFEATGPNIADPGVLVLLPPGSTGPSTGQSAPAGRSCSTAAVRG